MKTTDAKTQSATLDELHKQTLLPHVCSKTVSARECPPCAAHYALANADGEARARRDVLVNAVLVQARKALDYLDLLYPQGVKARDAMLTAFSALDAHDEACSSGPKVQR